MKTNIISDLPGSNDQHADILITGVESEEVEEINGAYDLWGSHVGTRYVLLSHRLKYDNKLAQDQALKTRFCFLNKIEIFKAL